MRAYAKVRQADREELVGANWQHARMIALARIGKLPPLDDWLKEVLPQPKRTVRDMILALKDAKARGMGNNIRKVEG